MVTAFSRFTQVLWPNVRWAIQPGESPLFGPERGCDQFEQRLLRFDAASDERSNEADDEVLYVPWGQFVVPGAFRKNVHGLLEFGATLLWNISV